ncbi:WG repeat-containing protein [Psychroserpens sp. SPM9]|uniref:WG repeat-containing protein n=1 Tax=Psychroserpens sp. SPM9 TaxID=2975598 RepID=UPI0021A7BD6B|nr:WG repeat-containing protein [Psychroserpens sp. SPM9]MDG5490970.1 WG repeat-containing protein [Psychroserpens sp. SPM9]
MKKIIAIFIIALSCFQFVNSQNLDKATINKIKVKIISAEKLYEQGKYWDVLDKIKEIEAISKGMKSAKIQNLKVKTYMKVEMFQRSKDELNKLYNMNPDDKVIEDIASYESLIDQGIMEEKARKERERLAEIRRAEEEKARIERERLADLRRAEKEKEAKERERLAEIKREEERKARLAPFAERFKYLKRKLPDLKYMNIKINGGFAFINEQGEQVLNSHDIEGDFARRNIHEGVGEDLFLVEKNYKYGYVDINGNLVISFKYNNSYGFSEGLANVQLNGKWGFINKSGAVVIPIIYDDVDAFNDGLAKVELNGKCGHIDKNGKVIISIDYEESSIFSEGLASVKLNGKWGYVDKAENVIVPFQYDETASDYGDPTSFSDGLAGVKLNGSWGFINKEGTIVIPAIYDFAYAFKNKLASVGLDGKCGWINTKGKGGVPIIYDQCSDFDDGLALVQLNDKWGFINKEGEVVIPIIYKRAYYFSFTDGLEKSKVELFNGESYYINKKGERVE